MLRTKLDLWYSFGMPGSPTRTRSHTRDHILAAAEEAVLAKGFAATSIDEIIAAVGITKSGFFYHFKDKATLAKALLQRSMAHDERLLDDLFRRADELNEDPLHGLLVGLKLFAEMMGSRPNGRPACLAGVISYQDQLFNQEVRALSADGVLAWRTRFRARFDEIAARYPPRDAVDLDALADMAAALVGGGIALNRALADATILPRQIMLYRDFVRALFASG